MGLLRTSGVRDYLPEILGGEKRKEPSNIIEKVQQFINDHWDDIVKIALFVASSALSVYFSSARVFFGAFVGLFIISVEKQPDGPIVSKLDSVLATAGVIGQIINRYLYPVTFIIPGSSLLALTPLINGYTVTSVGYKVFRHYVPVTTDAN